MNIQWWREVEDNPPKAHWLGLFKRRLPLDDGPVVRIAAPFPEIETGIHHARVTGDTVLSLPARPVAGTAGFTGVRGMATQDEGTVKLGRFSNEDIKPSRPEIPATVEDQLWEKLRLATGPKEPDSSLEQRLAPILQAPAGTYLSANGPLSWALKPFPFQRDGIDVLLSRDAVLLADDMGLGKTLQAVAALRILVQRRQVTHALIVVPAGLVSQWRQELRRLAPELGVSTVRGLPEERAYQWGAAAPVFLTGYETLRSDLTPNPASPPRRRTWDLVILDEAQKIKNREAEVSAKCKLIPRRRAWALTGTPLENSSDDLASIMEFTCPLQPGEHPPHLLPGFRLRERHRDLQLRRKKADVLPELPPKIVSEIIIPLAKNQRETYDRAERDGVLELRQKGETVRIENVLELILRLKQLCNFCPRNLESSKLEDIEERLSTLVAEGHRALIFSQFIGTTFGVGAIARKLVPYRPLVFSGALSTSQKDEIVRQFKADPAHKVMVLSLRAGGQGLNLQEASYVFHFDRWWNPAVEHQAEDRSHRLGQLSPVHVYKYTSENTIEERIGLILQRKQQLFNELVDDVSLDIRQGLTAAELFGLFGLTPPEEDKGPKGKS